jgi:site-specific DNA-methyltransferase (adenine-specific)
MKVDLRLGDCLEVLKTILDNSIDSVITDPPYHLTTNTSSSKGFMGKEWDGGDIAFRTEVWSECLRVLKPGGHLLAFSHSRTYHRMAVAVEDAGFEIRDQIMWIYASGFPKSHNIGKAIQKQSGDVKVIGTKQGAGTTGNSYVSSNEKNIGGDKGVYKKEYDDIEINNDYEGWGTALKPAHEPIVMARKPLTEKSIAENVLKYGTGGINIDGSRITIGEGDKTSAGHRTCNIFETEKISGGNGSPDYETHEAGRFPANIIFDEEAGQLLDEQSGISKTNCKSGIVEGKEANIFNDGLNKTTGHKKKMIVGDYNDKGGASRFFYCPKTSKKDRNEGCNELEEKGYSINQAHNSKTLKERYALTSKNNHPTVKPTDLMRYLINLITPPNGTTLDPFMGSGSTGKAAVRCGVNFIGIEKEQEYMDIASARIQHEQNKPLQTKLF